MQTIDGVYAVRYMGTDQKLGEGVVILNSGRVFGIDLGFYYLGNYKMDAEQLQMTVTVSRHSEDVENVMGLNRFDLDIVCRADETKGNEFKLRGFIRDTPLKLDAMFRRLQLT